MWEYGCNFRDWGEYGAEFSPIWSSTTANRAWHHTQDAWLFFVISIFPPSVCNSCLFTYQVDVSLKRRSFCCLSWGYNIILLFRVLSYYCFVDVLKESIGVLTEGINGLLSCILSKWAAITCYILSCNFMNFEVESRFWSSFQLHANGSWLKIVGCAWVSAVSVLLLRKDIRIKRQSR